MLPLSVAQAAIIGTASVTDGDTLKYGYPAEVINDICDVVLAARDANVLKAQAPLHGTLVQRDARAWRDDARSGPTESGGSRPLW